MRGLGVAIVLSLAVAACVRPPAGEPPQAQADTPQDLNPSQPTVAIPASPRPAFAYRQALKNVLLDSSAPARVAPVSGPANRERYGHSDDNPLKRVAEHPVSTFSIDVDTGAYANVRRMLMQGRLPPADAVRAEELVNYFGYQDAPPDNGAELFRVNLEMGPTPWNSRTRLLRVALKARDIDHQELAPANLVFLVDVSGSMRTPDKLPLLKRSLQLLTRQLDAADRVSIVVYAGASGVVLEPTPADQSVKIAQALEALQAGGSTNGAEGIELAYAKAREAFIEGGINRVILATDGDFNVGTVDHQALLDLVRLQRESGIGLTTLGFGSGNYNDRLMEQLADTGNGNHAYIDSLLEARKVLVEQLGGTLQTVASDVKIQVEFNPARVSEYRLIGYENRLLRREDFNNDRVDAGEIGAGHSVVALYEVALKGEGGERLEPLRYADKGREQAEPRGGELAYVRLRFKKPGEQASQVMAHPLYLAEAREHLRQTSDDFRFAAAVAAFAQRLRGGVYLEGFDYDQILALARDSRGADPLGHRGDFLRVAGLAQSLQPGHLQAGRLQPGH